MVTLIAVLVLSGAAVVATLRALPIDGYRRIPTDPSRLP
jgi:hypothetical protein